MDDLYVGYLDRAPRHVGLFVRRVVVGVFLGVVAVAALLVAWQQPFGSGKFEYGQYRQFSGEIRERPYPELLLERESLGSEPAVVSLLLGEFGKSRPTEAMGKDGMRARLEGALSYRGDAVTLEIERGSIESLPKAGGRASVEEDLGLLVLVGEIVDSKCYSGVMKPSTGKVHRSCAARCISGGIAPLFVVRDDAGNVLTLLLVGREGQAVVGEVLDFVAEPVRIEGRVLRRDDRLLLKADLSSIERLGDYRDLSRAGLPAVKLDSGPAGVEAPGSRALRQSPVGALPLRP